LSADITPPVPISSYVLGNVQPCGAGVNPDQGGYMAFFTQYEGQNVLPTFWYYPGSTDFTASGWPRFENLINAFQNFGLRAAWDTLWNGAVVKYAGTGGASATITDTGTIAQFKLQQTTGSTLIYQRVHQSNQAAAPPWVPNWPAYNSTTTLGLDPSLQFWDDSPPNDPTLPHITSLPAGDKLGLATGTLVTPQFSYFQLEPAATSLYDFFANLWLANEGITYNGVDLPLQGGAVVEILSMTAGGVTRQGIFAHPPFSADVGGETFFEYTAGAGQLIRYPVVRSRDPRWRDRQ
jgi:hypothetical protein